MIIPLVRKSRKNSQSYPHWHLGQTRVAKVQNGPRCVPPLRAIAPRTEERRKAYLRGFPPSDRVNPEGHQYLWLLYLTGLAVLVELTLMLVLRLSLMVLGLSYASGRLSCSDLVLPRLRGLLPPLRLPPLVETSVSSVYMLLLSVPIATGMPCSTPPFLCPGGYMPSLTEKLRQIR